MISRIKNKNLKIVNNLCQKILLILLWIHWWAGIFNLVAIYEESIDLKSWRSERELENTSEFTKYIDSCYFMVVIFQTVGFGEITPVTSIEKVLFIIVSIGSSLLYAMIFGLILEII